MISSRIFTYFDILRHASGSWHPGLNFWIPAFAGMTLPAVVNLSEAKNPFQNGDGNLDSSVAHHALQDGLLQSDTIRCR